MQIGIISDIHGNEAALDAVLDELARCHVDEIICLGDAVDPLPGSEKIFRDLSSKEIPLLRGNHEDYIVLAAENPLDPLIADPKFKPVHLAARSFSKNQIEALKKLPLSLMRQDSRAGKVFLCHASPNSNRHGWKNGSVDFVIQKEIEQIEAQILVGGHWHIPAEHSLNRKTLVTAGAVGIPFNSKTEAEFLILDSGSGEWVAHSEQVEYNIQRTLEDYRDSGWLMQGAPISLLYLFEIATGQRSLAPFFFWAEPRNFPTRTLNDWKMAIATFLRETGRQEALEKILRDLFLPSIDQVLKVSNFSS